MTLDLATSYHNQTMVVTLFHTPLFLYYCFHVVNKLPPTHVPANNQLPSKLL